MYKIYSDKKCALVNEEGVKVSKSVYDDFVDFDRKNGIYKSKLNGKIGLMNYNGKILIPAKFETIEYNPNSHFCIVKITHIKVCTILKSKSDCGDYL